MKYGIHEKCGAFRRRDGRTLICGRSAGHSVLKCYDPDGEEYFIAPERKGFPKIQPLGIRKLTPLATELREALEHLRAFLDPDDPNCGVPPEIRKSAQSHNYLDTWVEGPIARALAVIDPRWRAEEEDRDG
jgi:hypothetical protein